MHHNCFAKLNHAHCLYLYNTISFWDITTVFTNYTTEVMNIFKQLCKVYVDMYQYSIHLLRP